MGSYNLEFQFLDLSGVSNEDVKNLLDCLNPQLAVPGVELPWSLSKNVSFENLDKEASSEKKIDGEQQALPNYLPSGVVATQSEALPTLDQLSISTAPVVSETPQFSANAPVFIPASVSAMPTNMGVPPFTVMPQNMQQFPPQFLQRRPFSMSGTYSVQMDSMLSPNSMPVVSADMVGHHQQPHGSPNSRHIYTANNSGQLDANQEETVNNRLKHSRHYSSERHNSRPKTSMKKKNHTHVENTEICSSSLNVNMVGPMDSYRVSHMMTQDDPAMMGLNPVVSASDLVSPDHMGPSVSNNGPPPNMVPLSHPFTVPLGHAPPTYQTQIAYSQPHHHQPIYFFPISYMPQPGSNSPVVTNLTPLVDNEAMVVGNVSGPPPGLYEGSPLTMSHPLSMHQTQTHHHNQQHHVHPHAQRQNMMLVEKDNVIQSQECYVTNSSQEVCPTSQDDELSKDNAEIVSDSDVKTITVELNSSLPSEEQCSAVEDKFTNSSLNVEIDEGKQAQDDISVAAVLENQGCHSSEDDSKNPSEGDPSVKNRTITPEPTVSNNMEDSGVDLETDSPQLPTPPMTRAQNEPNKRWSDLFKSNNTSSSGIVDTASKPTPSLSNATHNGHSTDDSLGFSEYELQKIGRLLQTYKPDFTPQSFQSRGLINRSNWCYINATLQALLVCSPFHNLIKTLQNLAVRTTGKSKTPILSSLVKLISEFDNSVTSAKKKKKDDLNIGHPFEPVCMHAMLSLIKSECIKGRQEDAEEFLSCILNGLHDEMVAIIKTVTSNTEVKGCNGQSLETNGHLETASEDDGEDQDWRMMGKKGKGSGTITRTSAHLLQSPVKAIFGGMTRSLLTSGTESSATLQPFFTLQLDIQADAVDSVEDALSHLIIKESIQGYTCSKTKKEVEASRRMTLEELPPVLILHFKRFVYDDKDGGSKKVLKKMDYPLDLELKKELLSSEVRQRYSAKYHRNYRLFAVVYHDGKEAVKGHYVADVYHSGINAWLHCDDRNIKTITETDVLTYNSPCVPYLLFYGREMVQNQVGGK